MYVLKEKLEMFPSKRVVFNESWFNLSGNEKKSIIELLKKQNINFVNITSNIEDSLLSNYVIVYDEDKNMIRIHDIKLDALEDLIEGTSGKPVLIAYWYKSYLRRIKDKFDVRELKTNEDFKKWNQGKIPVAITYPASAGHGLNLQAGYDYYAVQKRVNEMIQY